MSNTHCTRCHGTGSFGPAHVADGVCFRCGRRGAAVRPAARTLDRAAIITALHGYVLGARSQGADWSPDAETLATIRGLLAAADADVRARAIAALPAFATAA